MYLALPLAVRNSSNDLVQGTKFLLLSLTEVILTLKDLEKNHHARSIIHAKPLKQGERSPATQNNACYSHTNNLSQAIKMAIVNNPTTPIPVESSKLKAQSVN